MTTIRPLETYDRERFLEIATGYTATERYVLRKDESEARTAFTRELEALRQPFKKAWEWRGSDHKHFGRVVAESGCSFGAYETDVLVGVAIAEPRPWFDDLCVWELHVHASCRRRGVGRRLIEVLAERARERGLRMITCETQNTNVPAIRFYRSVGVEAAGIDLWFYPPENDEVALFMRRVVGEGKRTSCS